jgi:3-oxoacyl-[acyl-carrier-protein] synthase-3
MSGHLWGDGAVAYFFSDTAQTGNDPHVIDITTQGLGHVGLGPQSVFLTPGNGGLQMPYGKDVFLYACNYISQNTREIVENSGYTLDRLSYFIGHQANMRILKNVTKQLDLSTDIILSNIEELGNTGSASALLVYAQNTGRFRSGDLICISVFGGGYSAGTCLLTMP